jgi:UPF0755 protein
MRVLRRLFLLMLLAAAAGVGALYVLSRPYAGFSEPVILEIPRGSTTREIASRLAASGVVESPWQFLAARALRPSAKLQAGEYRFAEPASALDVYGRIARGDVFHHEVVIPEGFNMFDIAALLEKQGLASAADFLEAARDPSLIRDLAPEARTLEGYLFPDTYRVPSRTPPRELCRILTRRFRAEWKKLQADADAHRTVTLASLVEKETGVPEERPLVASVYHNRLRIGMKLDCDPTTLYAAILEGRYRGAIHVSDLASTHPYNTYKHPGLPPGPIANPGEASLRAALNPADTPYLYFVAHPDGSGRHQFSKDLASHNAAANRYRRANGKK